MKLSRGWRVLAVLMLALCAAVGGLAWGWATRDGESRPASGDVPYTRIVDALRDGDVDFVLSRLSFKRMSCGLPLQLPDGEVRGPECLNAEAEGTLVAVFPIVSCDARFVRAADAPTVVRGLLAKFALYGGIKLRQPNARQRHYALQEGSYGIVGRAGGGSAGLMVSVSSNGDIVNLWPGCGEFATGLMDERFSEAVLFGPLR